MNRHLYTVRSLSEQTLGEGPWHSKDGEFQSRSLNLNVPIFSHPLHKSFIEHLLCVRHHIMD